MTQENSTTTSERPCIECRWAGEPSFGPHCRPCLFGGKDKWEPREEQLGLPLEEPSGIAQVNFADVELRAITHSGISGRSAGTIITDELGDLPPPDDKVYQPSHYARYEIEPVTFIMKNGLEFWLGNVVKYALRAGHKTYDGMDAKQSEITDLKKAQRYLEMRINQLEGDDVL